MQNISDISSSLYDRIASQIYVNFPFEPTVDQKKVIDGLAKYMATSSLGDIFILNGYAGTGKTTLISVFVNLLKSKNIPVFLMAPTGRAAKVLSRYSSMSALTIHKMIYRQKGALVEKFELEPNKHKNAYFIVDEASMVSDSSWNLIFGSGNLLEDVINYVNSGDNCRLIFIGDKAQLPPIGSEDSPALSTNKLSMFGSVSYYEMRDVVRQKNSSGILAGATKIRNIIDSGVACIPKFDLNFPDVKAINGAGFIEELESCYSEFGAEDTLVITRSNKQAGRFNEGIRSRVICQEEELSSGDLLMVVKNNYFHSSEENNLDFIANGDIAEVVRVRGYEELYGLRFVGATLRLPDYNSHEIECKIILDTLRSDTPSLSPELSQKMFEGLELDYSEYTRKAERYTKIREDNYYNALQVKFGYAVTCHKAQGGQWSAVFIDCMIWGDQEISIDLLRWLYTAFTRARVKLYLINFPDDFFIDPPDYW